MHERTNAVFRVGHFFRKIVILYYPFLTNSVSTKRAAINIEQAILYHVSKRPSKDVVLRKRSTFVAVVVVVVLLRR